MRVSGLFLALVVGSLVSAMSVAEVLVGGIVENDGVTDDAKQAASVAVNTLSTNGDLLASGIGSATPPLSLVAIKSVRTQVVAGVNYFLELAVSDATGKVHNVDVTVWSRPWLQASNSEEAWKVTAVQPTADA